MHGFYRLNILRGFTIITLLLVSATALLVVVTNFRDNNWEDTFFSSVNHILLLFASFLLIVSEVGLFASWFEKYLPLVGPQSALVTLGLCQIYMTSYFLADRHCVITEHSPPYLNRLLLGAGIISGCSGFFNILMSFFFRGSKPGKMRTIRQHGTPVPDTEKGSIGPSSMSYQGEESNNMFVTLKNAFTSAGRNNPAPNTMNISRPMQYE